jgi:hypothetical protein
MAGSVEDIFSTNPDNPQLKQKALQDLITYIYARSGTETLRLKLGGFGDALDTSRQVLNALNKLNTVATTNFPDSDGYISYNAHAKDAAKTYLWDNVDLIKEGFQALSFIVLNNGKYSEDNPSKIPDQQVKYLTSVTEQLSSVVSTIKGESEAAGQQALLCWFNGLKEGSGWSVQTNLSNAIQQFEFFNTSLKNSLGETMVMFEQYADSATAALTKIARIARDITRQIG